MVVVADRSPVNDLILIERVDVLPRSPPRRREAARWRYRTTTATAKYLSWGQRAEIPKPCASGYSSWWLTNGTALDAYRRPFTLIELQNSLQGPVRYDACAFLHSRTAGGRPARIVAVEAGVDEYGADSARLRLQPETFTWSWPPQQHRSPAFSPTNGVTVVMSRSESFTLYAGQPDPVDSSHFTIGYVMGGKTGTIDGRLNADGTAKLTVRDGPLFGRTDDTLN